MPRRLIIALAVVSALVVVACSVDSPKLRSAPPVSNAAPATTSTTLPYAAGGVSIVPGITTTSMGATTTAPPGASPAGCTTTAKPAATAITRIATATDALTQLPVYDSQVAPTPCELLPNPDPALMHAPVLIVLNEENGRLQVKLPTRPNNSIGWITARDVTVATTDYQIRVSLSGHRVQVFKGLSRLVDTPAGVGTGDTPTPPGIYYVVALIKPTNDGYGPYAYALSAHSERLETFAGGDGRIGLHGTNDPSSIGKNVSHGCIRIPNDVITRMAEQIGLPLGTPVIVTA